MKKIGLLALVLLFGATIGFAQPRGGERNFDPEQMAKRQTERLDERLELTKDQEEKVYALNLDTGKKMQKMRESNDGDFEGMREQMLELRNKQNAKMKDILTDKQWKEYEKYQEERRERMRDGRGRNR